MNKKPIDVGFQCIWNEAPIIRGWAKTMLYFCDRVYALLDPRTNDGTLEILKKEYPEITILYQLLILGDSNDIDGRGEKGIMTTHMNTNYFYPLLVKEGEWSLYLAADERFHPKDWESIVDLIQQAKREGKKGLIHYTQHEFYFDNKTCADLDEHVQKIRFMEYDKRWVFNEGSHGGKSWRYEKNELLDSKAEFYHFGRIVSHKPNMNWRYHIPTADWTRFGGPEGKFPTREYVGPPFDNWKELDGT